MDEPWYYTAINDGDCNDFQLFRVVPLPSADFSEIHQQAAQKVKIRQQLDSEKLSQIKEGCGKPDLSRHRNRMNARYTRLRKKYYVEILENTVQQLEQEKQFIFDRIESIKSDYMSTIQSRSEQLLHFLRSVDVDVACEKNAIRFGNRSLAENEDITLANMLLRILNDSISPNIPEKIGIIVMNSSDQAFQPADISTMYIALSDHVCCDRYLFSRFELTKSTNQSGSGIIRCEFTKDGVIDNLEIFM